MIELGHRWAIAFDSYNMILMKRQTGKGGQATGWSPEGYYSSLRALVRGAIDAEIRAADITPLEKLQKRVDEFIDSLPDITIEDIKAEYRKRTGQNPAPAAREEPEDDGEEPEDDGDEPEDDGDEPDDDGDEPDDDGDEPEDDGAGLGEDEEEEDEEEDEGED